MLFPEKIKSLFKVRGGSSSLLSKSLCDRQGRVFIENNKVYRAIFPAYEQEVMELLNSKMFEALVEMGWFPKTKVSSKKIKGFNLVLKHEKLLASEQTEWSFFNLKEAVLLLLKLEQFLNVYGYQLWDGHLYNILFKNNRPMFVDLGSIQKKTGPSCFYNEVLYLSIYPLVLMSMNERFLARSVLTYHNYMRIIPAQQIENSEAVQQVVEAFFKKHKQPYDLNRLYDPDFLEKYLTEPQMEETLWANYQTDFYENQNLDRFKRYALVNRYIQKFTKQKRISVCDLAGNQGALLYYLEQKKKGKYTFLTNVDYDESAIEASQKILISKESKVSSYLFNFMLPKRDLYQDFKHDVVLALAVTHHLVLSQKFHIDAVFEQIKKYAKELVFVEFMPLGLWDGTVAPDLPPWYLKEWFTTHFKNHFKLLKVKQTEANRILFVGKVKGENRG